MTKRYRHVDFLWDDGAAASASDEVARLIYRSNLLGKDLRITNFAGGNTSCKAPALDPLTGGTIDVLWVKGSGGDIGTMQRADLASLRMDRLLQLRHRYRGAEHEDEMVGLLAHCLHDPGCKAPSIDTPLHAFLPAHHVDHLHPDAVIAIATARDGAKVTEQVFGGRLAWLDWLRPGFELAMRIADIAAADPKVHGVVLGGHGVISWADTSYDCYCLSLDIIEAAATHIAGKQATKAVFGGVAVASLSADARRRAAASAMPTLRGLASTGQRRIGHFVDSPEVLEFVGSRDCARLAAVGTSCPDHFLRTKVKPLLLPLDPGIALDPAGLRAAATDLFGDYAADYAAYYAAHRDDDSPALRDPAPSVILWPGLGLMTFATDKKTARVAGEYFVNAINVMRGADALGGYVGLAPFDAFRVEYWRLEEAKLRRLPPERRLSRRVALVSGAASGIGLAIADRFLAEGACVVMLDRDADRLREAASRLRGRHDEIRVATVASDVRDEAAIDAAFADGALAFGGIDTLINNAGLSVSGAIDEFAADDYDLMSDVMARGSFLLARAFVRQIRCQRLGGDIVYIASKNGVFVGPSNVAYGSIKAAQAHQARLLAAEVGGDGVRVNVINPDAVIRGSGIWAKGWAEGRAKAYGIPIDKLPEHYAKRTLLGVEITPEDVAAAAAALVGGDFAKTTGAIIPVDGGIPGAFPR